MLKRLFILSFLIYFTTPINSVQCWRGSEGQVLRSAAQENRPVVAVFLSAQGCPWSQKLFSDVLGSPLFREKVGAEAILWQVLLQEGDKDLREKYHVQVCPQILLLDPRGKEFARMEYLPLDAMGYAAEIHCLIENFQELCRVLEKEDALFEEQKWQDLYAKAQKFSAPYFKQIILERGLQQEKGTFFHVEKFAALLEKYKPKDPQVQKLKKQLLDLDPDNAQGTHFKVAVLEYKKTLSRLKKFDRMQKPLKPLLQFVSKFGKTDQENLWKAELMIAEYLFTKNSVAEALKHARASYLAAPGDAKQQIAETIAYMNRE
jgi:protein disulfide-isomerase